MIQCFNVILGKQLNIIVAFVYLLFYFIKYRNKIHLFVTKNNSSFCSDKSFRTFHYPSAKDSGAVYCNRSCLWRAGGVCSHDNSKLRGSIITKLGLYVKVVTISS